MQPARRAPVVRPAPRAHAAFCAGGAARLPPVRNGAVADDGIGAEGGLQVGAEGVGRRQPGGRGRRRISGPVASEASWKRLAHPAERVELHHAQQHRRDRVVVERVQRGKLLARGGRNKLARWGSRRPSSLPLPLGAADRFQPERLRHLVAVPDSLLLS